MYEREVSIDGRPGTAGRGPGRVVPFRRGAALHGGVSLGVRDLDRAVEFYGVGLGLELVVRIGDDWAELRCPGLRLALARVAGGPERGPAPGARVGFLVGDLDRAMAALAGRGVAFAVSRAVHARGGGVRVATFADPDGNPLYLCEVRPCRAAR